MRAVHVHPGELHRAKCEDQPELRARRVPLRVQCVDPQKEHGGKHQPDDLWSDGEANSGQRREEDRDRCRKRCCERCAFGQAGGEQDEDVAEHREEDALDDDQNVWTEAVVEKPAEQIITPLVVAPGGWARLPEGERIELRYPAELRDLPALGEVSIGVEAVERKCPHERERERRNPRTPRDALPQHRLSVRQTLAGGQTSLRRAEDDRPYVGAEEPKRKDAIYL